MRQGGDRALISYRHDSDNFHIKPSREEKQTRDSYICLSTHGTRDCSKKCLTTKYSEDKYISTNICHSLQEFDCPCQHGLTKYLRNDTRTWSNTQLFVFSLSHISGHRCTHDTAENCRNDILVTGINRIGPSIRSGPAFCPRVNATPGGSPEILVSSGLQRSIRVKVDHIAQFIIQTR